MTLRLALAFALVLALGAAPARADVVPIDPRVRPVLAPRLVMVSAGAAPDAPAADVAAVERAVREQLAAAQSRVRRCLDGFDLREDPLRSRARRLELRLRFSRRGRPARVWVHQNDGMPRAAEACVLEAARAVNVPAPRGEVLVRAVYALR